MAKQIGGPKYSEPKVLHKPTSLSLDKFEKGLISIDSVLLESYIADTEKLRSIGLRYVSEPLKSYQCMFFIFESPKKPAFDNAYLHIPVDIGFIDKVGNDYKIVDIQHIKPATETKSKQRIISKKNALMAIEMNGGSFRQNGLKIGSTLTIYNI